MIRDHYVYRLYDAAGALLYIGCTRRLKLREQEHRACQTWWPDVARKRVQGPFTRDVAYERERQAILEEEPRHNGRSDRPPLDPPPDVWCPVHERVHLPVGPPEIADRLGVKRSTVDMWQFRKLLPTPNWKIGGRPAWDWPDIEEWARSTHRI